MNREHNMHLLSYLNNMIQPSLNFWHQSETKRGCRLGFLEEDEGLSCID